MNPTALPVEILKDIRDGVHATRDEVRATNVRLDETRADLGTLTHRVDNLANRVVESEIRTATAIVELHETVRDVASVLRAQHDLRPRVERCEQDIADLRHELGSE